MAQTLTAGILEQAALMRNYETILIQIQGRDCVAIEARYHRRCYLTYTKCLTRKPKIVGPTLYDKVFDEFCVQVIEKRIIQNNEVLLLSYLLRKFVSCVQAIEKIDVPYQATRLKRASLKCSDLCQCIDCQNRSDGHQENEESDSDTFNLCDDYSSDDSIENE